MIAVVIGDGVIRDAFACRLLSIQHNLEMEHEIKVNHKISHGFKIPTPLEIILRFISKNTSVNCLRLKAVSYRLFIYVF